MIARILLAVPFLFTLQAYAHDVAVVDVQKVFDGYQKVKDARERLDKSKKIAMEELEIFRDELEKIVKELKEMEEKLKNPNIESSSLKAQYQEKVKKAKEKQDDMVAYDKRAKATIAQRQKLGLGHECIRNSVGGFLCQGSVGYYSGRYRDFECLERKTKVVNIPGPFWESMIDDS